MFGRILLTTSQMKCSKNQVFYYIKLFLLNGIHLHSINTYLRSFIFSFYYLKNLFIIDEYLLNDLHLYLHLYIFHIPKMYVARLVHSSTALSLNKYIWYNFVTSAQCIFEIVSTPKCTWFLSAVDKFKIKSRYPVLFWTLNFELARILID